MNIWNQSAEYNINLLSDRFYICIGPIYMYVCKIVYLGSNPSFIQIPMRTTDKAL